MMGIPAPWAERDPSTQPGSFANVYPQGGQRERPQSWGTAGPSPRMVPSALLEGRAGELGSWACDRVMGFGCWDPPSLLPQLHLEASNGHVTLDKGNLKMQGIKIMLSARSQTHKATHCMTACARAVPSSKATGTERRAVVAGAGAGSCRVQAFCLG